MTKSKPLRIYELVDTGFNHPSCQSKFYARTTRHLWHVAAMSVKQAYYLAANRKWRDDGIGPGIVEETLDDPGTVPWITPKPPKPAAEPLPKLVTPDGVRDRWEFL